MIRNAQIMLPDQTNGKVRYETGSMLVRAGGGQSWFANNAGQSPDTRDLLSGGYLTDRFGNRKRFNADGDMIELQDSASNITRYDYVLSGVNKGAVAKITDERGQETRFTYSFDVATGYPTAKIETVNSTNTSLNRSRDLLWRPVNVNGNGGSLKVTYADPDGVGPRAARQDVFNYNSVGILTSVHSGAINNPTHTTTISYNTTYVNSGGWLVPVGGNGRLASITYPDGSITSIDITRQTSRLIDSFYSGGPILAGDPRALSVDLSSLGNSLPNDTVVTFDRVGANDPQRTITQTDHRGRVLRRWEAEQVFQMGLATVPIDEASLQQLQTLNNLSRSHQYSRQPTTRDSYGRITGQDYGEVLSYVSPIQDANKPRQTTTWTLTNDNPTMQQRPVQNAETFVWNDTFDKLTRAIDATGNSYYQILDASGRVTQKKWEQQSIPAMWQNPIKTADVNNDGFISPLDALVIANYRSTIGDGPVPSAPNSPPPYYDANGDNNINLLDYLAVVNAINFGNNGQPPSLGTAQTIGKVDLTYSSISGLPTNLVTQETISSGRSSGDQVITYSYHNTSDKTKHGKLNRITEAVGAYTEFNYDSRGNLNYILDQANRVTKMWYDSRDRMIARMSPDPDGTTGSLLPELERFDYDVFDNLIAKELINSWVEPATNLLRVTALKSSYTYDAGNRITQSLLQKPSLHWYFTGSGLGTQTSTAPTSSPSISPIQLENYALSNSSIINTPLSNSSNRGLLTTYQYFGNFNEVTVTESDNGLDPRVSRISLDRLDRITKSISPVPGGGAKSVTGEQLEAGGYVTTYAYDYLGNLKVVKDALGNETRTEYDQLNRPVFVDSPAPVSGTLTTSTSYAATGYGWRVTESDPLSNAVSTQMDMFGRVVTVWGSTPTVQTSYWTDGLVSSVTDELGRRTDYNYDVRGRLTTMQAPPATPGGTRPATSYGYTVDSLVSSVTDPLNRVTTFAYDNGGRLKNTTQPDPDGAGSQQPAFTELTRDSLGNVVKSADAFGQSSQTRTRDSWFRPLTSTDPAGAIIKYTYDVFGNTLSFTDPLTNVTTYAYNKLNRLTSENKGTAGSRSYSYDAAGNLREQTDRNNRITTWNYDKRYRTTSETWSGVNAVAGAISYSYDNADRLTSITDSFPRGNDFTFTYDSGNQVQNEQQYHDALGKNVLFDRNYDKVGNRTKLAAVLGGSLAGNGPISGGIWDFNNTYYYDGLDRLTGVEQYKGNPEVSGVPATSPKNNVAAKFVYFTYDFASQLTDTVRYTEENFTTNFKSHTRNTYDFSGRLTSVTHGKAQIASGQFWNGTSTAPASLGASNTLAAYFLSYDKDNRLTGFSSWRDGFKTDYVYKGTSGGTGFDSTDELLSATSTTIPGLTATLPQAESYNPDANGNRRTSVASGSISQSAIGTHNRLQTDGTFNYLYDNEGNVTKRTRISNNLVTEYSWDHRNRMTQVIEKTAAGTVTKRTEFTYDAFNQRTGKLVDIDGNTTWDRFEIFVWADGQEVFRFLDNDGQGAQTYLIANRYLWSNTVDQLLADEQYAAGAGPAIGGTVPSTVAGTILWALGDHLGSVRDLVDNNGVIRQHLVYDSFGRQLSEIDYNSAGGVIPSTSTAAVDTLFGYTGRDWDSDTGLQYNRARWYDPAQGRWLSQDPIGFAAGDANLYRYVGNGPTNRTDPSGLWQEPVVDDYLDPDVRNQNESERKSSNKNLALPPLSPFNPYTNTNRAHFLYPPDSSGKCWQDGRAGGLPPTPIYVPGSWASGGTKLTMVANKGHVYVIVGTPDGHTHSYGAYPGGMGIGNVEVDTDLKWPSHAVNSITYVLSANQEKALADWINTPWTYINDLVRPNRRVCIDYAEDTMDFVLRADSKIMDGQFGWRESLTVGGVISEIERRKDYRREFLKRNPLRQPTPAPPIAPPGTGNGKK